MDFQSESKILFTTVTFTWRLFEGLRGNHVVTRKSEKKNSEDEHKQQK